MQKAKRNGWALPGRSVCLHRFEKRCGLTHILPGSGLPLLDLLKDLNVTPGSTSRGLSTAEDWITMSTASGLQGFPMSSEKETNIMSNIKKNNTNYSRTPIVEDTSDDLWLRVTAITAQPLLDA
jgi:hypothetical protein